jgi:hypothetical protein
MHSEVPFYCVAKDALTVDVDTINIVTRVEGVIMDVIAMAYDMTCVTLDIVDIILAIAILSLLNMAIHFVFHN